MVHDLRKSLYELQVHYNIDLHYLHIQCITLNQVYINAYKLKKRKELLW